MCIKPYTFVFSIFNILSVYINTDELEAIYDLLNTVVSSIEVSVKHTWGMVTNRLKRKY